MATKTVVESGHEVLDTTQLRSFARALRKVSPALYKKTHEELLAVGEIVAAEARILAAEHSETIPRTIKPRATNTTVSVVAGGPKAPIAGLFELGNNSRKSAAASRSGTFRHPVFGDKSSWVDQKMHPYLLPAAEKRSAEVEVAIMRVVDAAVDAIVFDK